MQVVDPRDVLNPPSRWVWNASKDVDCRRACVSAPVPHELVRAARSPLAALVSEILDQMTVDNSITYRVSSTFNATLQESREHVYGEAMNGATRLCPCPVGLNVQ
jgi:hypothetical protein